jgi:hypothetical protein
MNFRLALHSLLILIVIMFVPIFARKVLQLLLHFLFHVFLVDPHFLGFARGILGV